MRTPRPDPLDPDRRAAADAWASVWRTAAPLLLAIVFFRLGWLACDLWMLP